jgi:hypothetical protein
VGHHGPLLWAWPEMNSAHFLYSNRFSTNLILNRPIGGLPKLKKIQIKYAFEGFDERNNFL